MPLDQDTMTKLQEALGDGGKDLFSSIAASTAADVASFDTLRSSAASSQARIDVAVASATSSKKERDQAQKDLKAANTDDALQKMTAERDAATKTSAAHESDLKGLRQSMKTDRISQALRRSMYTDDKGVAKKVDAARQDAAMQLMMGRGIPNGVDFDGEGKLMGHVELTAKFAKDYPFLVSEDKAAANQGGGNGSDGKPNVGDGKGEKTSYERAREAATAAHDANILKLA